MGKLIDLTGRKFGRLTVISRGDNTKNKRIRWHCQCDCGGDALVVGAHLKNGNTQSCGCIHKKGLVERQTSHGMSETAEYATWMHMKQRCDNISDKDYKDYGGRGIEVCDRWRKFENFYEDMGPRPKGASINRINNDGNYEPGNCEWAGGKDQARNKSNNCMIEYDGQIKCLQAWADKSGIPRGTIKYRITHGWTVKQALETPVKGAKKC